MKTIQDYLKMQKEQYEHEASYWTIDFKDPVVGSYKEHNEWEDYDKYLFKDFDTTGKVALEYGCGPGRNLLRYKNRFARIDGTDIGQTNLLNAITNLMEDNEAFANHLFLCDGQSIPVEDKSYDVVFSVICLQHIASHTIRQNIFKDAYRVLKNEGYLCFQMGYGGKPPEATTAGYYEDAYDAGKTNSGHDVVVDSPEQLQTDLEKIGFKNFKYDIRPRGPGDSHAYWIWVQVQKIE